MGTGIIAIAAGIAMGCAALGKHGQAAGSSRQCENGTDCRYGNHGNHRCIDIRNSDCFGR